MVDVLAEDEEEKLEEHRLVGRPGRSRAELVEGVGLGGDARVGGAGRTTRQVGEAPDAAQHRVGGEAERAGEVIRGGRGVRRGLEAGKAQAQDAVPVGDGVVVVVAEA